MTVIQAKSVNGQKIWYIQSVRNGQSWTKEYPNAACPSDFYTTLENELGLPNTVSRQEVNQRLWSMTWDGVAWTNDRPCN